MTRLGRAHRELICCPQCAGEIDDRAHCKACSWSADHRGPSVVDFLGAAELGRGGASVSAFYEKSPFPGYAPDESAASLLDRARQNPFFAGLDAAIGPTARALDCGCGTGQIASALALRSRRRTVVGVDITAAQLDEADRFKQRASLGNLALLRADIFDLPLRPHSFDLVLSRGVVHHTEAPLAAIGVLAQLVAPGGLFVLGYYDGVARLPHRMRRGLARTLRRGQPLAALDPVLRRADLDEQKKENWIADQYHHPLERQLSLGAVRRAMRTAGLHWVRSVPPAVDPGDLTTPTRDPGWLARTARRAGWLWRGFGDADAGLVCVIGRAQTGAAPTTAPAAMEELR